METIILKDGDVLSGEVYSNISFDTLIRVDGDDVLIDDIIVNAPKKDFDSIIEVNGKRCRIKNCRFSDISVKGVVILVERKEEPSECIIEGCLFYGGLKNGSECIILRDGVNGGNIIYNNRFENMDRFIDIISVKNSGNLICNNEVVNCEGGICINGDNNMAAYNFFDGKDKKISCGINVSDDNNSIIGNIIFNIKGNGAINLMCGEVKKCYIIYNTIFNCLNGLCLGIVNNESKTKPDEVYLQGNTFVKYDKLLSNDKRLVGVEKLLQGLNRNDKTGE